MVRDSKAARAHQGGGIMVGHKRRELFFAHAAAEPLRRSGKSRLAEHFGKKGRFEFLGDLAKRGILGADAGDDTTFDYHEWMSIGRG